MTHEVMIITELHNNKFKKIYFEALSKGRHEHVGCHSRHQ